MNKILLYLGLLLACSAGTTFGKTISVEFSGQVTSKTPGLEVAIGAPLTGMFTYDPAVVGLQSSTTPIFTFAIAGSYSFKLTSYTIGVRDNYSERQGDRQEDSLILNFAHPSLSSGAGGIRLSSFNTDLFNGDALPTVVPALEAFDASRSLGFHYDFGDIFSNNYWAVGASIDRLQVVPEPSTAWFLGGACVIGYLMRSKAATRKV